MLDTVRKTLDLLDRRGRRQAALLLVMIMAMAVFETAGVASILPFVAVLASPQLIATSPFLKAAHDGLGFTATHDFLVFLGIVVFLVTVGSTAFKALTTWSMLRFTGIRQHALATRLFEGYLGQPYAWFLRRHSADLGKTMLAEVSDVVNGAVIPALQLIAHGTVALLLVALLVAVDPLLAMIVSVVLGGAYVAILWMSRRTLSRIGKERVLANRARFRTTNEAFSGIKDVKVRGVEDVFLRRFEKPSLRMARFMAASQSWQQLPYFALQTVAFGGILLIVQYLLLTRDDLTTALPLIALYALAGYRLMPALQQVYQQLSKLRYVKPALDALHRDLADTGLAAGKERAAPSAGAPLHLADRLELKALSCRYPGAAAAALDRISLVIPARSTVALVGRTGSGKTTAVDVILGLLDPSEGQLLVDGVAITPDNQRAWRRSTGYVPQSIFLADDTVAANIAFGSPPSTIDMAAVERAARIANLHDFVIGELEKGYDTVIGERGLRLSGGQRQRVGIARALYHDPDVLIMDEATSALDTITERAVMDAVSNLERQKTIILVAHRLSTVRRCDTIFMLERGRVLAAGTFDQLCEKNEHFQTMTAG